MAATSYGDNVFINCPFDRAYKPLNDPDAVISLIRNWLRNNSGRTTIPGGRQISRRYASFGNELPKICSELQIDEDELTFNDYANIVSEWLREYG